jgi:hypothetical protein
MKLTNDEILCIQNVIKTAELVGIGNIIIEPGCIRAMDEDQTVVLFQDKNVPEMSFGSIGLNRISLFNSRLEVARAQDNFSMDAVLTGEDNKIGFNKYDPSTKNPVPMWVRSLTMNGKGTKIDYRCASSQTIKAPKNRAGVAQYRIDINPEMINMIIKGSSAMKADEVSLIGDKNGCTLEMADINGDSLEYHFTDVIHNEGTGTTPGFEYKYLIKLVLPLLKRNPTGSISITSRGTLIFTVNNLDIYIMARS